MKKKAEMGIGTLIIFIAMILVAAIAAGVLIQTATTLQNKALLTGERSKSQVSTSIRPMLVYAEDGSTNNNVSYFFVKLKLAPGSDPIKFSEMLFEFSLKNSSSDLEYLSSMSCSTGANSADSSSYLDNESNGTPQVQESNATYYGITYLIQGDNYKSGYLQRGDVVKLCFESGRNVGEDETVTMTLVPKVGNPTTIETALPDIITDKRITIFP